MKTVLSVLFAAVVGSVVAVAARGFFAPGEDAPEVIEAPAEAPAAPVPTRPADVPPPSYAGPGFVASPLPERPVWVEGVMMRGAKVWVYLSDGRVYREITEGLTRVDREGAVIDGHRMWMRPTSRPRRDDLGAAAADASAAAGRLPTSSPGVVGSTAVAAGSWRLDPDGVHRLVASSTVGKP